MRTAKPVARYRVVRPLEYVVDGDARNTVRLPAGHVVDAVFLSELPFREAAPLIAMNARDTLAGRAPVAGYAYFRTAGQVRAAVYGRDVVAAP